MFEPALRECFRLSSKGGPAGIARSKASRSDAGDHLAQTRPRQRRAVLLENAAQDLVVILGRDIFGKTAETKKRTPA